MKKLFIIRHAKAENQRANLSDFDRRLTESGMRDIQKMGEYLRDLGLYPEQIWASPASRTSMTAEALAEELDFADTRIVFEDTIYEASLSDLKNWLSRLDNQKEIIFLVGHNPSVSQLTDYLTNANTYDMPTAGVAYISFLVDDWGVISKGSGKLEWLKSPMDV